MKGILALAGIIGGVVAFAYGDRRYGDKIRNWYDRNERRAFPISFSTFFILAAMLLLILRVDQSERGFEVGYRVLMAMGLNIVVGYAGLLDLGYVAFFAIGAYTMAIFSNAGPLQVPWDLTFWEILPIGIVIAIAAGLLLGAPTLRLRGDYLAIVTLGFGEIVRLIAENLDSVTNGSKGIAGVEPISAFGKPWLTGDPRPYYLLALATIAIFALIIRALNRSRIGRAWAAIREDETAAEAMGVPTLKYKLYAFAIGAAVASMGGMLFAPKANFVDPKSFVLIESIFILSAVVLGGIGSTAGAMVGMVGIIMVPEALRALDQLGTFGDKLIDARFGIFGLALVLMMIFRPQGIVPSRRRAAELKGGAAESGEGSSAGSGVGSAIPVDLPPATAGGDDGAA